MPGWYPCCCGQDGPDFTSECGPVCLSITGAEIEELSNCAGYLDLDIDRENFEVDLKRPPGLNEFTGACNSGSFGQPEPFPYMAWRNCLGHPGEMEPDIYPYGEACVGCFQLPGKFPNLVYQPNYGGAAIPSTITCFDDEHPTWGAYWEQCTGGVYIDREAYVWVTIDNKIINWITSRLGSTGWRNFVNWPAYFKSTQKVTDPFDCDQNLEFDFVCQSEPWDAYYKPDGSATIKMPVDFSNATITMKMGECFKCNFCTSCGVANELSAVVTGVVNGSCGSCNLLNGTWSCPNFSTFKTSIGEICSWGSPCFTWTGNTGPCGNFQESASMVVQGTTEYVLGVPTRKLKATMEFYSNIGYCNPFTAPTSYVTWERTFDEEGLDCTNFENELLLFVSSSSDLACDFSGSSVFVSVAP